MNQIEVMKQVIVLLKLSAHGAVLNVHDVTKCIDKLEQQIALCQIDVERIWAMMPELRNTEAQYDLFEAMAEKLMNERTAIMNLAAQITSLRVKLVTATNDALERAAVRC